MGKLVLYVVLCFKLNKLILSRLVAWFYMTLKLQKPISEENLVTSFSGFCKNNVSFTNDAELKEDRHLSIKWILLCQKFLKYKPRYESNVLPLKVLPSSCFRYPVTRYFGYIWNISNITSQKNKIKFNLLYISEFRFYWVHQTMLSDTHLRAIRISYVRDTK